MKYSFKLFSSRNKIIINFFESDAKLNSFNVHGQISIKFYKHFTLKKENQEFSIANKGLEGEKIRPRFFLFNI